MSTRTRASLFAHLVFDDVAPAHDFRTPGVVRMRREGRTLTVLSSVGAEPILDEARTLGPVSMDVAPVTLKKSSWNRSAGRTEMLWYKAWLETRWRFVIGVIILGVSACGAVLAYPELRKLLEAMPEVDLGGAIGRRIAEGAELAREYRGYVWSQWFRQNMTEQLSLFAAVLGTGGLLAQTTGGGALFTLSLPVSRTRLLGVRAVTGLTELLVLALTPAIVLPLVSPVIGERYSVGDALVHSACMFVAGSVLFSIAFLLSTVFRDVWRPALLTLCVAFGLALVEQLFAGASRFGLFGLMCAESYFRGDGLPWLRLLVGASISATLLVAATRNIARQDF